MSIDSEGKVDDIRGRIVLTDGKLDFADVGLDAENIPYRVPGTYDLVLSAQNVQLSLPGRMRPGARAGTSSSSTAPTGRTSS